MRAMSSAAVFLAATLVLAGCAGYERDSSQRTVGEWTDDAAILSIVKARLLADDSIKSLDISAQVRRGVVTLFGVVATPAQHTQAIEIARGVRGVTDVVDRLVVVETAQ